MRREILSLAVLGIGALALCGCSTDHQSSAVPPANPGSSEAAIPATDLKNTVCPVSGDKVGNSTDVVVYDGKVYHMCCPDCHNDFVKNPQKYSAMVTADPAKYGVAGATTQPS